MEIIDANTVIKVNKKIMTNMIDNEVVMMSPKKRIYIGLNPIGTKIWGLVQEKTTFKNLTKNMMLIYEINEDECRKKISNFILKLEENDLLSLQKNQH